MTVNTPIYLEFLREILLPMPGVTKRVCYRTIAFYEEKKIFARIKENDETLVVQTHERDKWMEADPIIFFLTAHYLNYDYMLISLRKVSPDYLTTLLVKAWYNRADRKLRGI